MVPTIHNDISKTGNAGLTIGPLSVVPENRTLAVGDKRVRIEPRMMAVLVTLYASAGQVVSRNDLVQECWSGAPVGDDSINRAIAGVRRSFHALGVTEVAIETVHSAGYVLRIDKAPKFHAEGVHEEISEALHAGYNSWRIAKPEPDLETIQRLRTAATLSKSDPEVFGMLAFTLRHAVEYAPADLCADLILQCEAASRKALSLDSAQGNALAALIGMWPIFGDWSERRNALLKALDLAPDNMPLRHELAILEMATGRIKAAVPIISAMLDSDPLAPILQYKRIYHLWSLGQLSEMDQFADRALQFWSHNPAIWLARLWSLAFTDRPSQALQQVLEDSSRPAFPQPMSDLLVTLIESLCVSGDAARSRAVEASLMAAREGPAQCAQALIFLSGIEALDEAFEVAEGYYLRRGSVPVAVRKTPSDPSINDQHRRITQLLFIPSGNAMRKDARFMRLCDEIGLTQYWEGAGIEPDFLSAS